MTLRTLIAAGLITGAGVFAAHAQDTIIISPEQETVIRDYVTTQSVTPVEKPSNFELVVGAIIPDILKPGELADNTVPGKKYQYVVIDGRTAIIEPETRRVVHILQ